jgi:2-phospho-L-lactate guanylyltransferase
VEGLVARLVVSSDWEVLEIAEREQWMVLEEGPRGDLNSALRLAAAQAQESGAQAIMVVPTDLPLARRADIGSALALLQATGTGGAVVAAPDRHGTGTNLLATHPINAIPFLFGPNSLEHHREAALTRGIPFHTIESRRLALDLDKLDDLALAGLA